MTSKAFIYAATAAAALSISGMADARSMRAVGSSTVYPFAKMAAERVARANPRLGTPIIESTGTGAGFKLFCAGVGERFPDISNASRRMKAKEAAAVRRPTASRTSPKSRSASTASRSPPPRARRSAGSPSATSTSRSPRPRSASRTRPRPGRTSTPSCRRFRSASTARRRPAGTRDALGELLMTPPCEANASMAALKKSDEAKFKAICTGIRTDGAYIEAGENDNLIVQKLAANPGTLGIFGYSFLEENAAKVKGVTDQRRRADLSDDLDLQISGRPSALHLRQECARPGDPGDPRLRRRDDQGKRDRSEGLHARRRPGRRAGAGPRPRPAGGAHPDAGQVRRAEISSRHETAMRAVQLGGAHRLIKVRSGGKGREK